jgi:toxin-antitoxin system PIN domain toxin
VAGSLFDVNVWIALVFESHPFHSAAESALTETSDASPAIFSRSTEQSFLRLLSTPKLLTFYGVDTFTNRDALGVLRSLLTLSNIVEREEPHGTADLWHQWGGHDSASPKVWMDAYLAAFAIKGEYQMITLDRDFEVYRPRGLKLIRLNG